MDAVEMRKASEQLVIGNDRETWKKIHAEWAVLAAWLESANCHHETTMARERRDTAGVVTFENSEVKELKDQATNQLTNEHLKLETEELKTKTAKELASKDPEIDEFKTQYAE